MSSSFFVYLLMTENEKNTYIGATINLNHRLRQHNREIKGGAHATSMQVLKGHIWKRVCYVSGFPTWQSALQFEWRWKQLSRNIKNKTTPLQKRMMSLNTLLNLEQSTSKAILFKDWTSGLPQVHCEDETTKEIIKGMKVLECWFPDIEVKNNVNNGLDAPLGNE